MQITIWGATTQATVLAVPLLGVPTLKGDKGDPGEVSPEAQARIDAAIEVNANLTAVRVEMETAREQSVEAAEAAERHRAATGQDRTATTEDRTTTGQDRAAAEQARIDAQLAAIAAALNARYFDTIAAGRAGVADDEAFAVRAGGADGLTRATIYRRDSAAAQSVMVEIVASSEVDRLNALVGPNGNQFLLVAYDSAGQPVAYLDDLAEWHLARLGTRSLQQHIVDLNEQVAQVGPAIASIDLTTSTALWRVLTSDGRSPLLLDDIGNLYLAKMGARPVQDQIRAAQDRLVEAAPAIDSVQRVASPHIRRTTSAENHVIDLMDELGNWYVPRLGHKSVQDHILELRDKFAELPGNAVAEMLKRRRVYDGVHDFAVPNDGLTDAFPRIQAALDQLSSQSNLLGPSILYLPPGAYRLERYLWARSNVTLVMAGWGKSRLLPIGLNGGINYSGATPLTRANFIDVEIDGSEQFDPAGARVGTKGMFFQRWSDCQFLRCFIHDTWATGLGIDFSPGGSWILDGRYEGCGRGSQIGDPGSSGIGIGTGVYDKEPLIISRNICRSNKNFGIFLERQHQEAHLYVSRQNIISENICSENGWGIGEVGGGGTVVIGNQANDNLRHGLYLYSGTIHIGPHGGPHPGVETMFAENVATGNGQDGLRYDATRSIGRAGFYTDHNQLHRNAGCGMRMIGHASLAMTDFAFRNDEIKGNGAHGMLFAQGNFRAVDILHPRLIDNTGAALQIDAALTDSRILGLTARSTLGTALQTTALAGSGALTNVDISECVQTGHATPTALIGPRSNLTLGRNPGLSF
ncbi:right-handed parallel beta-helix repeat-containing protein [Paracoccus sp. PAR01]|uniref:right-handed parallel beta-helix repeat-containing protein n=1 Tax=Paracoccus sp. PAR01 TaxID=2769282 RepID=UPI00177A9560|nr:right-handed parallel beta-helix repeat-containing protein [Paracoccus sp. PAR01]MBD9528662.1 right-handed parallel beta-helix repeat-containing protein [Paracoccus sp. PAR01]